MDIKRFTVENARAEFARPEMDVRNAKGGRVELIPGMWYVGMNWLDSEADTGAGAIAQYVGDGEFYDEGDDEPTRMQDYEYIVESHMGRL